jgi:hypothetical protein
MTQTSKKLSARLLAFASLLSVVLLSSSAPRALGEEHCETPVGTWLYTVTIPPSSGGPIVFSGTETYDVGGGYSEADELGVTPYFLATPGHGVWKSTGEGHFLLTYDNFTYDANGPSGTGKVRQTTIMSKDGNSYTGSGDFFYYNLNGNVSISGHFTITAKRILVEKPE